MRALREQQVEASRLLQATRAALEDDKNLLGHNEYEAIGKLVDTLEYVKTGTDRNVIESAIAALSAGTEEFAARRMDRSVRTALTGKRVEQI